MGAEHDHAHEGELFPRQAIAGLVGAAEGRRERMASLQTWVIAAGLVALALGLPAGNLSMPRLAEWTDAGGTGPFLVLGLLARGLVRVAGMTPERAWFLLAAVSWGLALPALTKLLSAVRFDRRAALVPGLIVLASVGASKAATEPSAFGAGVLATALLLRTLFTGGPSHLAYAGRAAAVWTLAACLHPEAVLLLPAVLHAILFHVPDQGRRAPARAALLCLPGTVLVAGAFAWAAGFDGGQVVDFCRGLVGERTGPTWWGPALLWLVWWPLFLGAAGLALLFLVFARRPSEESPPPRWLLSWCAAALVPTLLGQPPHSMLGAALMPVCAVALADRINRDARQETVPMRAWGLLVIQVLLAVGFAGLWRLDHPERAWLEKARVELSSTDLVVTSDPRRAHILRLRWGLETVLLPAGADHDWAVLWDTLAAALADDRRVVVDLFEDISGGVRPPYPTEFWMPVSKLTVTYLRR